MNHMFLEFEANKDSRIWGYLLVEWHPVLLPISSTTKKVDWRKSRKCHHGPSLLFYGARDADKRKDLTQLYQQLYEIAYESARSILGKTEEARIIAHEVAAVTLIRHEQNKIANARAYATKSARHLAIKVKKRKHLLADIEIVEERFITDSHEEAFIRHETNACQHLLLEKAIASLKPRQAEIFCLHIREGVGFQEIADKLDRTYASVSNTYYRAQTKVKTYISRRIRHLSDSEAV
ncbi:MAG: sigma-70 family RNA polymerase sigma factor [Bacteroidota bacterium]